ncbi:DNA polymerase zeta [Thoreauomyces humboldtii]|nr:DNA polymerase zeta [Thoreauomyces humboldtii]
MVKEAPPSRNASLSWLKAQVALPSETARGRLLCFLRKKIINLTTERQLLKPVARVCLQDSAKRSKFHSQFNIPETVTRIKQYTYLMSMELHVNCREGKLPDPALDPVSALFYCLHHEDDSRFPSNGRRKGYFVGVIIVKDESYFPFAKLGLSDCVVEEVEDERALIDAFVSRVRHCDPDLLVGYDIERLSWGYLVERCDMALCIDLLGALSRVLPDMVHSKTRGTSAAELYNVRKQTDLSTPGRLFLHIWRFMKAEMNLTSYTLESTAYHVLHIRVPKYTVETLTQWYRGPPVFKWRVFDYFIKRVQYNLDLLDDTQMITRTGEFARVFGIDFWSVLTRGSQYRVESMMARMAKPENMIMLTPSKVQVAKQRACECLPLVMEPISRFYTSPVLVLDFQSLYPSIMIAYNYCYSTCLGRVQSVGAPHRFGVVADYEVPAAFVEAYKDHINVSPNGMAFVKNHVREGTLRRMLSEILDTRVMIKKSMKLYKDDKSLSRILEARQLSLKFIANVTYGYTGASFSGRMPCVEIADAIVQTGRATLEKAITLINNTKRWGAEVVYGDTDSLFVHLPGVSKDDAFKFGKEMVDMVTAMNPEPMKLKFEKVYLPCMLLAKKRYVGFKYENPEDTVPEFDAKGIETVRRDGCPAQAKMMEDCLKTLFRTKDLSEVKAYVYRQFKKILENRISLQDFIIAKEVKLGTYSDDRIPPPGALIGERLAKADHRAAPPYGYRVPYVIVHNGLNFRVSDSAIPPEELLASRHVKGLICPALFCVS